MTWVHVVLIMVVFVALRAMGKSSARRRAAIEREDALTLHLGRLGFQPLANEASTFQQRSGDFVVTVRIATPHYDLWQRHVRIHVSSESDALPVSFALEHPGRGGGNVFDSRSERGLPWNASHTVLQGTLLAVRGNPLPIIEALSRPHVQRALEKWKQEVREGWVSYSQAFCDCLGLTPDAIEAKVANATALLRTVRGSFTLPDSRPDLTPTAEERALMRLVPFVPSSEYEAVSDAASTEAETVMKACKAAAEEVLEQRSNFSDAVDRLGAEHPAIRGACLEAALGTACALLQSRQ